MIKILLIRYSVVGLPLWLIGLKHSQMSADSILVMYFSLKLSLSLRKQARKVTFVIILLAPQFRNIIDISSPLYETIITLRKYRPTLHNS